VSEEIKALVSLVPELYKDLAQPTVRNAGNALGEVADLIAAPVGRCASILKNNVLRTIDKLSKEHPENVVQTKHGVAVPILEKMRYVEEEALADAYAELLKNSCLKDRQAKVLPAYSEMLSRLTPDEVKILDLVYRKKNRYKVLVKDVLESKREKFTQKYGHLEISHEALDNSMLYPIDGIPYIEVRSNAKNPIEGFEVVVKYFTDINEKVVLSNPENFETYIENLRSLRIFDVEINVLFPPASIYDCLVREATRNYRSTIEQHNRTMELLMGRMELTSLAQSFLAVCTSSEHDGEPNSVAS